MRSRSQAAAQQSLKTAEQLEQQRLQEESKAQAEHAAERLLGVDTRHPAVKMPASLEEAVKIAPPIVDKPVTAIEWGMQGNDRTVVSVTIGKESFFPVKYNGFDVGPVVVSVDVRVGETVLSAYERARDMAQEFFLREYEDKCRGFAERLKRARDKVGD